MRDAADRSLRLDTFPKLNLPLKKKKKLGGLKMAPTKSTLHSPDCHRVSEVAPEGI